MNHDAGRQSTGTQPVFARAALAEMFEDRAQPWPALTMRE
jgi:hypothetical protein